MDYNIVYRIPQFKCNEENLWFELSLIRFMLAVSMWQSYIFDGNQQLAYLMEICHSHYGILTHSLSEGDVGRLRKKK